MTPEIQISFRRKDVSYTPGGCVEGTISISNYSSTQAALVTLLLYREDSLQVSLADSSTENLPPALLYKNNQLLESQSQQQLTGNSHTEICKLSLWDRPIEKEISLPFELFLPSYLEPTASEKGFANISYILCCRLEVPQNSELLQEPKIFQQPIQIVEFPSIKTKDQSLAFSHTHYPTACCNGIFSWCLCDCSSCCSTPELLTINCTLSSSFLLPGEIFKLFVECTNQLNKQLESASVQVVREAELFLNGEPFRLEQILHQFTILEKETDNFCTEFQLPLDAFPCVEPTAGESAVLNAVRYWFVVEMKVEGGKTSECLMKSPPFYFEVRTEA